VYIDIALYVDVKLRGRQGTPSPLFYMLSNYVKLGFLKFILTLYFCH